MKKYIVYFTTKDDDYDKEWRYADFPEEAAEIVKDDLWNVARVYLVEEIK